LFVDPGEIPGAGDVAALAAAAGARGWVHELMVCLAAYSGLRWGELAALTAGQVDVAGRRVAVDRKVVEVRGRLFVEDPKNRKRRRTIYPRRTPGGWPLAGQVARRAAEVVAGQAAGRDPMGLMFPAPAGGYWRSSNFGRRVLRPAFLAARWRGSGAAGDGMWTWHSLRHVFCTTALLVWGLDAADVSRLAGHATTRTTLDMYVGATAGALDRAHRATD
jgi:integrase